MSSGRKLESQSTASSSTEGTTTSTTSPSISSSKIQLLDLSDDLITPNSLGEPTIGECLHFLAESELDTFVKSSKPEKKFPFSGSALSTLTHFSCVNRRLHQVLDEEVKQQQANLLVQQIAYGNLD